jgi:hypothetical protein
MESSAPKRNHSQPRELTLASHHRSGWTRCGGSPENRPTFPWELARCQLRGPFLRMIRVMRPEPGRVSLCLLPVASCGFVLSPKPHPPHRSRTRGPSCAMGRTINESHSGGSSDAPRGTTPATPPAARVTAQTNSKLKKGILCPQRSVAIVPERFA